jgi:hypothetical protein
MPVVQSSLVGAYVPTSYIWDVSQLEDIEVTSPEFKELLVRMYQNLSFMAMVLNTKDTGIYDITEYPNSQVYFPNPANYSHTLEAPNYRQVFRKVINFGALPNTTTKSVAHGIVINADNPNATFTIIYATASDTTGLTYVPIPYSSVTSTADDIEIFVDATNVNIITGSNRSNYNVCYVVLEYLLY